MNSPTQSQSNESAAETSLTATVADVPTPLPQASDQTVNQTAAAALPMETSAQTLLCDSSPAEFEVVFLRLINEIRAQPRQCGDTTHEAAAAVSWNPSLEQAAQKQSDDMASRDFFSHTGSDNSSVADRVDATGYPWQRVGENIAAGQTNAEEALQGWLDSPGHCRNIMNIDFEDIAVTCVINSSATYSTYWTNVFGREFD